ncbi:DUF3775 domain-containing protein [Acidimangrovimonas sediminis]|uniref:DUF3775 domain-containing protein n=1 Tax=Acidimangrovimonas sediminis TaxID=2056283 RepID=UPI000C7FA33E|nr:DUF3775 domain-containing protein [Acidimangrovimonas sediminis]
MAELPFDDEEIEELVLRFNAVMAKEDADIDDPGGNPTDDEGPDVLQDSAGEMTEDELIAEIEGMNEEQQHALVALFWIGREDGDPEEWDELMEQAAEREDASVSSYLLGQPMVSEYLEAGLERMREAGELD